MREINIRIGTRRSNLAQFQARHVGKLIQALEPTVQLSFTFVSSPGDRDRRTLLGALGGVGAFTKESEDALLRDQVDIVVHSLKDLPTVLPAGLLLAAVPCRDDPRDVLCGIGLDQITAGTRIGTGSIRRRAQLLKLFPDAEIKPIRGNVPPRLRKAINHEGIDGTILAFAGLARLDLFDAEFAIFDPGVFPYAVGQGALGIEARADNAELLELLARLEHPASRAEVDAERAVMHQLQAGCSLPVGVDTNVNGPMISLRATVTRIDGTQQLSHALSGPVDCATEVGRQLAVELLRQGAAPLLEEATRWRNEVPRPAQ
jgi:hydroxymethylbilane synthase